MDKKPNVLYYSLVVGVTILFIGLAVQPSIATVQSEEIIDEEPKDYLFQTIIEIANNPEVKSLLERYNNEEIIYDYNFKDLISQLMLKKPGLLLNLVTTKPYITHDYLDKCYNNGIEITNIISEEKTLEMIETIKLSNPKILVELYNIIKNNEELSERINTLKEMNKEFEPIAPAQYNLIICGILFLITIPPVLIFWFFFILAAIFQNNPTIYEILSSIGGTFLGIVFILVVIMLSLECIPV
jgi:hypothetical protein